MGEVLRARNLDGEALRLAAGEGEGDEKMSSFSTGIERGLALVGLSFARLDPAFESPPDGERLKGDLLTYALPASPFKPPLCRGTRLPERISGLSFSLVPETTLSPEALLSPVMVGKATRVRSADTFLVPLTADPLPLPLPLADREVERGREFAEIPRPILAFGVDATPAAVAGASPIALRPARS